MTKKKIYYIDNNLYIKNIQCIFLPAKLLSLFYKYLYKNNIETIEKVSSLYKSAAFNYARDDIINKKLSLSKKINLFWKS